MPLVTFYFQLHQPFRLHPEVEKFLWEEKNDEIFKKVSAKNYLPATEKVYGNSKEITAFKNCLQHVRHRFGTSPTLSARGDRGAARVI